MTDVYEASVAVLRRELLNRRGRVQRNLNALYDRYSEYADSEYAEDHRRLRRIYDALLRTLEAEVSFERELRGGGNG